MSEELKSMSYLEYFLRHLALSVWTCFLYYSILFVSIPDMEITVSKVIFFIGNQFIWFVLSAFTPAKKRNKYNVFFNVILSYTPYFLVTHLPTFTKLITVFIVITLILSVLYFFAVLCKKVKNKRKLKQILVKRTLFALKGVRYIASVMASVLLITVYLCNFFGINLVQSDVPVLKSANAEDVEQWTIKNNMDTLVLLQEKEWKKLSKDEKLDVLSVVRNIETRYLGLSYEIRLAVKPTNTDTLGYYSYNERTVVISNKLITTGSAKKCLTTLCHEMQHAYQHNQIEAYRTVDDKYKNMLMFYNVRIYEEEFSDYISGEDDYIGYILQNSEIYADKYAESAVEDYYNKIELHLKGDKKDAA